MRFSFGDSLRAIDPRNQNFENMRIIIVSLFKTPVFINSSCNGRAVENETVFQKFRTS